MKSVREWFKRKKKKPEEGKKDMSYKGAKKAIRDRNKKRKEIMDQL